MTRSALSAILLLAVVAACAPRDRWTEASGLNRWSGAPEQPAEGRAGPRIDETRLELGLHTPPVTVQPPHPQPVPGDPAARAWAEYNCGADGEWCTVQFQAWTQISGRERLKVSLRTGSGQPAREAYIPHSTQNGAGPYMFAISSRGCEDCRIEFSFEDDGNGRIDSWAQVFLSRNMCGSSDRTNGVASSHQGLLYNARGRVIE